MRRRPMMVKYALYRSMRRQLSATIQRDLAGYNNDDFPGRGMSCVNLTHLIETGRDRMRPN